jgi:hypothetical protein|tara:strand:+ start:573 stop:839 length:267 start_codon:yes stop_codon:yes gene_type:complete
MFNNQNERYKMPKQKVWLVIEKNVYGDTQTFSVIKHHVSIDEAIKYKVYLEALNDRKNQTYFLASDTETVMNKVVTAHNKSVNMKEVA